ncbi:PilZ domain-containing protein [Methyloceanibacter superfactus]|uniref:PilZ domain-containing protein n=1 Tax=Methyloceanibacter superfactus TaxID=1774969 RepID=UPI001FCD4AC6|nr:PilZ domain-containing protein [Methyloceanibacter superfactus]
MSYPVADISVGGMRLMGDLPPKTHEALVHVEFDGLEIDARLVRAYKGGFAVQFIQSENARERLIRLVYGGKHGNKSVEIKPAEVMGAMINRVFR